MILSSLKDFLLNQPKFAQHMIAQHIMFNIQTPSPFTRTGYCQYRASK